MKVLFIRHATAVDKAEFEGDDLERPLSPEGREEARRMFKALARLYPGVDVIVSSKAVRARETAEILSKGLENASLRESELLNPGCDVKAFKELMREMGRTCETLAVVGHEPDFSSILASIVADGHLRIDVKKASCIEVDVNTVGKGELKLVLAPKAVARLVQ